MFSIAIETTSRNGSVALGAEGQVRKQIPFDAAYRHAAELIGRLDELLSSEGLQPRDLSEVYCSVGPGSFTGTRIGVVVARTLAQAVQGLRLVAVPTALAVALAAEELPARHVGYVLDAREGEVWAQLFDRKGAIFEPTGAGGISRPEALLDGAPRPLTLLGEGLTRMDLPALTAGDDGLAIGPEALWYPAAEAVWRVGHRLATAGQITPPTELRPVYVRRPAAERNAR